MKNASHIKNPSTTAQEENRPVIAVAVVIAIAIMGDSLMYSLLPLEAAALGISLTQVGILLSANRIVRFVSNTWASLVFEKWGARVPFLLAALLGVVSTTMYGLGWGFGAFLIARALWGIGWSAFRHGGFQAVSGASDQSKGRLMGLLWGIVRLGSAVSVLLGGYLYDQHGYSLAVGVIALITVFSVPLAFRIKWPTKITSPHEGSLPDRQIKFRTPSHNWLLGAGLTDTLFEGALVATASLFLVQRLNGQATLLGIGTLAGGLLALRFTANVFFAPLLGTFSDKIGRSNALVYLSSGMLVFMAGALTIQNNWALACLAVVFFGGSGSFATLNAAASDVANRSQRPDRYIGAFTTSIDFGAAIGPLLGFSIAEFIGFEWLYISALGLFLISTLGFWQAEKTLGRNHLLQ
ncbi:MAG: MFS transporter [Chloroflexota bacterium]